MANTFRSETFTGGSTAANTDMTVYTVPSSTTTIIIGLTISNLTNNSITVDVKLVSAADDNIHIGNNRGSTPTSKRGSQKWTCSPYS